MEADKKPRWSDFKDPSGYKEAQWRLATEAAKLKHAAAIVEAAQPVLDRLRASGDHRHLRRNQSPLVMWLHATYSQFSAIIAERGISPGWSDITSVLADAGLTKADGKPLTEAYVRQAWAKVKEARGPAVAVAPLRKPPRLRPSTKPGRVPIPVSEPAQEHDVIPAEGEGRFIPGKGWAEPTPPPVPKPGQVALPPLDDDDGWTTLDGSPFVTDPMGRKI